MLINSAFQLLMMETSPNQRLTFLLCVVAAMLDRIREIGGNARSVAGRVQKFIHTLTDSVRHVGECDQREV